MGPAHHRHDGRQAAAEPQKGLLVGVLPPLVGVICHKRGLVGVLPLCHSLGLERFVGVFDSLMLLVVGSYY